MTMKIFQQRKFPDLWYIMILLLLYDCMTGRVIEEDIKLEGDSISQTEGRDNTEHED